MSARICVRCGLPGADKDAKLIGPYTYIHSGCLVIWTIFAQEMGDYSWNYAPELLADLREDDGGPERWIPDDKERSGELDIGESAY